MIRSTRSERNKMKDLHQIKREILDAGSEDVIGEWDIFDLALFHSTGRFSRVWLMWETIKRFCLLINKRDSTLTIGAKCKVLRN